MTDSQSFSPPSLRMGLAITAAIALAVIIWIVVGACALRKPSYYVAFLLFWYWTTVGGSNFRTLPAAFFGAAAGLAVTWAMKQLTLIFGLEGVALGGLLIAGAVLTDIMGWARFCFNGCTTLFMTVMGVPLIAGPTHFGEAAVTLVVGTAFLSALIFLMTRASAWLSLAKWNSKNRLP